MGCSSSSTVAESEVIATIKAERKAAVHLRRKRHERVDFDSGSCTPASERDDISDRPLPPDMKMTKAHVNELHYFLAAVARRPVEFMDGIEWARENSSRLNGPAWEQSEASSVRSSSSRPLLTL
mmetsp:Transcript_13540/g.30826  ORF Transcript_13540/g.30826 Transcript_13540/m.30826 type:complete len:124 (-) Transcript_13540:143-514(-)